MTVDDHQLTATVDRLVAAGCVAAQREAEELVAAAPDDSTLEDWIRRREQGEPPAWITGRAWFGGLVLDLRPGVYVPRPQTLELARRAAAVMPPAGRALDLCTGSGAVAAHLQARAPQAAVVGVDLDPGAVACARANGVASLVGDLADPVGGPTRFDLITAVAPYVPSAAIDLLASDVRRWEPRAALDGGDDGLGLVRRIVTAAGRLLAPGGWLVLELGGDQDRRLAAELDRAGLVDLSPWHDEDGDLRGLACRADSGRRTL